LMLFILKCQGMDSIRVSNIEKPILEAKPTADSYPFEGGVPGKDRPGTGVGVRRWKVPGLCIDIEEQSRNNPLRSKVYRPCGCRRLFSLRMEVSIFKVQKNMRKGCPKDFQPVWIL